jgi:hypothetical protein
MYLGALPDGRASAPHREPSGKTAPLLRPKKPSPILLQSEINRRGRTVNDRD